MPAIPEGASGSPLVFAGFASAVAIIPLSMLPLLMLTRLRIFMISEDEDSMLELLVIIMPDLPVSRLLICLTGGLPLLLSMSCLNVILSVSRQPALLLVPLCL